MDREQINSLLGLPLPELILMADKVRREFNSPDIELCSIMNAKSGLCSQDCKFCAQSSRYKTGAAVYSLRSKEEMLQAAWRAEEIGAKRFGIVTSGDSLSKDELSRICEAASRIKGKLGIKMCASLGALDEEAFGLLKEAGFSRYHHNIETSRDYFPSIAITHTFEDRINTIKAAKEAGFEVCSGGIIGMGETMQDRVEMALCLKELNVDSVPINVLVPIEGTPLGSCEVLSCVEAIKTIAIFRIILKDKAIRLAAGRESILNDFQALGFMAGANGMLIGGYLTVKGREPAEDRKLVDEMRKLWQS